MTRDTPRWETIRKSEADRQRSNMPDYDAGYRDFSWQDARARLDGFPNGGLNIAHEAVDRHLALGRDKQIALRWLGRGDASVDYSYADLALQTNRFANVLARHGRGRGDRVFCLLGRIPAVYVAALGAL
ncbi:MAG: AMP-binding protein, partial [Pseudomonadota bacterium]